jgi:hypothetical protein
MDASNALQIVSGAPPFSVGRIILHHNIRLKSYFKFNVCIMSVGKVSTGRTGKDACILQILFVCVCVVAWQDSPISEFPTHPLISIPTLNFLGLLQHCTTLHNIVQL